MLYPNCTLETMLLPIFIIGIQHNTHYIYQSIIAQNQERVEAFEVRGVTLFLNFIKILRFCHSLLIWYVHVRKNEALDMKMR